jgi:hypothetical protein
VTPLRIPKKARRRHRGSATTAETAQARTTILIGGHHPDAPARSCFFKPIELTAKYCARNQKLLLTHLSVVGYSTRIESDDFPHLSQIPRTNFSVPPLRAGRGCRIMAAKKKAAAKKPAKKKAAAKKKK